MRLDIMKIKRIMLNKGIRQKDLADKGNIDISVLCRILKGTSEKSNFKTIKKIADGLEVKPEEIVKEGEL